MIKDSHGQVSLEYLLIFAVSFILLIVFTMPLVNQSMETALDVSDCLIVKDDLSKIASSINRVYGEGQGSKQTIEIRSNKAFKINVAGDYLSADLKLKDDRNKVIKVPCKSNLKPSSINIRKGDNKVIIEWPAGSEKMSIC